LLLHVPSPIAGISAPVLRVYVGGRIFCEYYRFEKRFFGQD
jgi:hypothetical protein